MDMKFNLLMFDLDGTLVDSALEIADATNDVLCSRGLQRVADADVMQWIGHGAHETVVHALAAATGRNVADQRADQRDVEAAMERFVQAYIVRCGQRSRLYPQVMETLQALSRAHVPMALVTNKESRLTERVLDVYGLRRFFDPVLASDTLPRRKPDPLPLHYCMEVHHVAPQRSLMIGDSPVDVAAARAAKAACWVVPYGYSHGRAAAELGADRVLAGFKEVRQAVTEGDVRVSAHCVAGI